MPLPSSRSRRLAALLTTVLLLTMGRAWAYRDLKYGFSVSGPRGWAPLRQGAVPGLYRFGWISDQASKDRSGANLMVFVMLLEKVHSSKELLAANVDSARTRGLKILSQEERTICGRPGFVMEVSGSGTGLNLLPGKVGGSTPPVRLVPTRQRWFAVVDGTRVVGIMSTCAESGLGAHRAEMAASEASLSFP